MSSGAIMLGTSPELRMLLTSSSIDSLTICVSENRKTTGLFSQPASNMKRFRSSWKACHVVGARDLDVARVLPHAAARRASDWRPRAADADEQRAAARLRDDAREAREVAHASVKKTRFIGFVVARL